MTVIPVQNGHANGEANGRADYFPRASGRVRRRVTKFAEIGTTAQMLTRSLGVSNSTTVRFRSYPFVVQFSWEDRNVLVYPSFQPCTTLYMYSSVMARGDGL